MTSLDSARPSVEVAFWQSVFRFRACKFWSPDIHLVPFEDRSNKIFSNRATMATEPMAHHNGVLSRGEVSSAKRPNQQSSEPFPKATPLEPTSIYITITRALTNGEPEVLKAYSTLRDASWALDAYRHYEADVIRMAGPRTGMKIGSYRSKPTTKMLEMCFSSTSRTSN